MQAIDASTRTMLVWKTGKIGRFPEEDGFTGDGAMGGIRHRAKAERRSPARSLAIDFSGSSLETLVTVVPDEEFCDSGQEKRLKYM